jgi:hypothetical protein
MSRRAPSGPPATQQGMVYTLHLDPPTKHAAHYTGWSSDLDAELARHADGRGARLLQVQLAAGGTWRVADVEPGTRDREQQLNERGAARRCSICKFEREPEACRDATPHPWVSLDPPATEREAAPELTRAELEAEL